MLRRSARNRNGNLECPTPGQKDARGSGARLTPLAVRRRNVAHTRNVIYGPAGRYNLLDLYQSRSAVESAPCLVYLHGGGYRRGKKNRERRELLYHLAARGWVCVSANYRLAPTGRYPDQLIDGAKRAIAWVGSNSQRIRSRPDPDLCRRKLLRGAPGGHGSSNRK